MTTVIALLGSMLPGTSLIGDWLEGTVGSLILNQYFVTGCVSQGIFFEILQSAYNIFLKLSMCSPVSQGCKLLTLLGENRIFFSHKYPQI